MVPPPLVRCFKPPIAKSCWLQRPIHLQAYPSRTQQRPPPLEWFRTHRLTTVTGRSLTLRSFRTIATYTSCSTPRYLTVAPIRGAGRVNSAHRSETQAIHISTTRALCRRVRLAACVLCCGIRGIHQTGISRVAAPQTRLRPRHPI
jgi:hypothetical protein